MKRYMDIKLPRDRVEAFSFWQNSWQAQLIPMLSSGKRIEVIDGNYSETFKHMSENKVMPDGRRVCVCADCAGDFSGCGDEEDR